MRLKGAPMLDTTRWIPALLMHRSLLTVIGVVILVVLLTVALLTHRHHCDDQKTA